MAQATSDPPEVKVCSSRMASPAQTSAQFLCLNMSLASSSTGRRKSGLGREWGEGKASWKWQGLFQFSWLWAETSPHPTEHCLLLVWIPSPRQCLRCHPVTQCHPLWLHCSILWTFDLPFLWIFPPLTLYCLPSLLLEYFLPEVCQTLNHLFACPCSGRTSSKGSNNKDLFICFLFFVYFKHFLPSSSPPSPQ